MSKVLLDASAILALLRGEPGWDRVDAVRNRSLVTVVNACEVLTRQLELGWTRDDAYEAFRALELAVVQVSLEDALTAADLRKPTKSAGLSLGDRICLAVARRENLPVLTADKEWATVEVGVEVRLIR